MEVAALEFFLLPEQTLVFRLMPGESRPRLFKRAAGRERVRLLVRKLRDTIMRLEPAHDVSREVYETLLSEAVADLPSHIRQLIIIPHDELNHLPFNALWSGREYLSQRFSVSQLPSLQTLNYIHERRRTTTMPCLTVGVAPSDPLFMQNGFEAEASDVAQRFGVEPILGADAYRDRVLSLLSGADVLHLVTHGHFVHNNALHSGLKLSPAPSSERGVRMVGSHTDQETLMAKDFLRSGLNASLVVLSACQTGLSSVFPGDELEGFTRALLYAGAASLVVSLWSVDTVATRQFMRAFYDSWHTSGRTKAAALRYACEHLQSITLTQIEEGAARELSMSGDAARLRILVELGDLYYRLGWLPEARQYYTQALTLATALKLDADCSLIQESLDDVFTEMSPRPTQPRSQRRRSETAERVQCPVAANQETRATAESPSNVISDQFTSLAQTNRQEADLIRPWAAPFFWAPFVLIGEWQ